MANPPPPPPPPITMDGASQDAALSGSSHLSRIEVLRRRSRRAKQLARIYKSHYWALMEELKVKYKEYYWNYGKSPYKDFNEEHDVDDVSHGFRKCGVTGCKAKAMPLTTFCHSHILFDSNQSLYKACGFVLKSAQGRPTPVICGKPVLKSTVPALCPTHFQKAEIYLTRALRKARLNISPSNRLNPKLHCIVTEFVRQIQSKRRAARNQNETSVRIEEDQTS